MSNIIIPSSPKDRKVIKDAIDEIGVHLTHIDSHRDAIKEIISTVEEKVEVKGKYVRKLASLQHKNKMDEFQSEAEDLETLYETISNSQQQNTDDED